MLRRVLAIVAALVVLGAAAVAVVALTGGSDSPPAPRPGRFYRLPSSLPHGAPGTIVRSQRLTGLGTEIVGWRVLYITHGYDNARTAVSGMILAPAGTSRHSRHVVVYAHPTVGIAPRCAPSVIGSDATNTIAGLHRLIGAGDVVVVPDYQGLGTTGPSPYLVPLAEARTVLDAARAAHKFTPVHAGTTFAVLGSSQGGQAALASAQLAGSRYGHGLKLVGVAAAAPPTRLSELFDAIQGTTAGNLLTVFTLASWAQVYGDPSLQQLFTPAAHRVLRQIDDTCIASPSQLTDAVPATVLAQVGFVRKHPSKSHAWAKLLHHNTLHPITTKTPMVVAQGEADTIVSPNVTTSYVQELCNRNDIVAYRTYPSTGHAEIGSASASYLDGWIAGRFARRRPPNSCPH